LVYQQVIDALELAERIGGKAVPALAYVIFQNTLAEAACKSLLPIVAAGG
jgi:hypothetical protein